MYQATEERLGRFEVFQELELLPETWTVLRLQVQDMESIAASLGWGHPFDARLSKKWIKTASYLLQTETDLLLGYQARDELTLLMDWSTHRDVRRPLALCSTYAGSASAQMSLQLGSPMPVSARIYVFPGNEPVEELFFWRQESARLATLTEQYVSTLQQRGVEASSARRMVAEIDPDELAMVLEDEGISFSDLPAWKSRGTCLYRAPKDRTQLLVDTHLPWGAEFRAMIRGFLE